VRQSKLFRKPLIVLAGIVLTTLLVIGPSAPTTEAAVSGCRADPLILLSDGTILDVSVNIGTNVANVTEILYVIHGPSGVKLVAALSTPTLGFAGRETFAYYSDALPGQYITETRVQTSYNNVGVTAYTTFAKATLGFSDLLTLQYKPVSGFNDQILRALLKR
jgi:hypothetical protein